MADAQTLKGAWSLSSENPLDVFGEHESIEDVDEVIMLQLMSSQHMRPGATTFSNAFDRDNFEHSYAEATLQMFLKTLNDMRLRLQEPSLRDKVECESEPFGVYVETVLREDPDQFIGEYDLGSTEESLEARAFMRNVKDNVVVDGYRFYAVIKRGLAGVSFGDIFLSNIDDIEAEYLKSITQAVKKAARNESGDTGVSLMSYAGESGNGSAYGRSLGPNDKWRLLRNRTVWAKTADMLLGIGQLGSNTVHVRDRISSRKQPYSKNPLNPRYCMSPILFMEHSYKTISEKQSNILNYLVTPNAIDHWKFPRHDLVLRVPVVDLTVDRFMQKMVPEYLARMAPDVMNRLMRQRHDGVKQRMLKRHRATDSASKSVLPMREMVQRSLSPEDTADLDDFLGADGQMAEAMSSQSIGSALDYVDCSMDDDDEDGNGSSAPAVLARVPEGGKNFGDIVEMLRSVNCRDREGNYYCVDIDALQREDFEDSSSLAARQMLETTDKSSSSSFHRVRFMGAALRSRLIDLIKSDELTQEECRRAYLANQRTLMRAYEDSCTSKTSNIMTQGASIIGWYEQRCMEQGTRWLGSEEPLMDPTMSIFANTFARWMLCMEDSMFVTSLHLLAMTAIFGSRDAYRHKLALHFNLVMTGDNSTGKSFVTKLVSTCSVPGTTATVGNKTANADFSDKDHNDMILINEELKPDEYKDKKRGGDDTSEAANKEFLTSMLYTKKVFYKGDDGSRMFRISVSQQISTLIGCSNLMHTDFSPAIRSRLSCVPVVVVRRNDRQTQDLVNIEDRLPTEKIAIKQIFIDDMQTDQFFQYHVEKLIGVHALKDVTLGAFDNIAQIMTHYLKRCHAIDPEIRTIDRAGMLARKLTIAHACRLLYSTPHSPYYKRPFEYRSLMSLDPLLHDNEEIACFAIELVKHEIVDRSHPHFVQMLKENYVERRLAEFDDLSDPGMSMNTVYMRPSTRLTVSMFTSDFDHDDSRGGGMQRNAGSNIRGARNTHQMYGGGNRPSWNPNSCSGDGSATFNTSLGMDAETVTAEKKFSPDHMNHYVRIAGTASDVARDVARWSRDSKMTLSQERVRAIMRFMAGEMIVSRRYEWDAVNHRPVVTKKPGHYLPGLIYTRTAIFIALDLFTCKDPLTAAIEFTRSRLTPEKRKYLRGIVYDMSMPHLLATREVGPKMGSRHTVIDHAKQVTASTMFSSHAFERQGRTVANLKTGASRMSKHYDQVSAEARCRALNLPESEAVGDGVCSFEPYERHARENYLRSMTCSYPEDLPKLDAAHAEKNVPKKRQQHAVANDDDADDDDADDDAALMHVTKNDADTRHQCRRVPKRAMVLGVDDPDHDAAVKRQALAAESKTRTEDLAAMQRVHEAVEGLTIDTLADDEEFTKAADDLFKDVAMDVAVKRAQEAFSLLDE
jgi:hypothetical protein